MASFLSKSCGRVVGVTPGSGWFALPEPREAPSAVPASVVPRLRFSHEPLGDAELPPRARRIHLNANWVATIEGTTSACAENTSVWVSIAEPFWNYLRVRGEYMFPAMGCLIKKELPPRARRIPFQAWKSAVKAGTTSACAENTDFDPDFPTAYGNYLRVRGEYSSTISSGSST